MIRKVVVPAAGLGTRLLPATKEQPKEMLPIFARANDGQWLLKPMIHLIFEQLHQCGLQQFCFVVGRGKRAIEDYLTPDHNYVEMLRGRNRDTEAKELENLYVRLKDSTIVWVNQPHPRGFGDAVLTAQPFVGDETFMVHAGDTYVVSQDSVHLRRLVRTHEKLGSAATFLVQENERPEQYGIVEFESKRGDIYKVKRVVEKPQRPPSNLAIVAVYIFQPTIFRALQEVRSGRDAELQLTDAIQRLIDMRLGVYAVRLGRDEIQLDIGNPDTYWRALMLSHQ